MRNSKKTFATQSTLTNTEVEISSKLIVRKSQGKGQRSSLLKENRGRVSIMKTPSSATNSQNLELGVQTRRNHISDDFDAKQSVCLLLQRIFMKKKRYCMQILKQFILFPEESMSSLGNSLSTYDPLIFGHEEVIHSLSKLLETQLMQTKMWAFINIRMFPKLKAMEQIEEKVTRIYHRTAKLQKKMSFEVLRNVTEEMAFKQEKLQSQEIKISPVTHFQSVTRYESSSSKHHQNSRLSSKTIEACIQPSVKLSRSLSPPQKITTTVDQNHVSQSRQSYYESSENKSNSSRYVLPTIRIKAEDYRQPSITRLESSRYYEKYSQPERVVLRENLQPERKTEISQESNPKKYNIIHYYESPRHVYVQDGHQCCKIGCDSHCQLVGVATHCGSLHSGCNCSSELSNQSIKLQSNHCCCSHSVRDNDLQKKLNCCRISHSQIYPLSRAQCSQISLKCHCSKTRTQNAHCLLKVQEQDSKKKSSTFQNSRINTTCSHQNSCRCVNESQSESISSLQESELNSRKEYLSFLKKVAQEQGLRI